MILTLATALVQYVSVSFRVVSTFFDVSTRPGLKDEKIDSNRAAPMERVPRDTRFDTRLSIEFKTLRGARNEKLHGGGRRL